MVQKLDETVAAEKTISEMVTNVAKELTEHTIPDGIPFFADLYQTYLKNNKRAKNGRRYDGDVKHFAAYVYIIVGRLLYETLSENLPLPKISTVLRVLHSDYPPELEGHVRAMELKKYLVSRKLPLAVWLSEEVWHANYRQIAIRSGDERTGGHGAAAR